MFQYLSKVERFFIFVENVKISLIFVWTLFLEFSIKLFNILYVDGWNSVQKALFFTESVCNHKFLYTPTCNTTF